MCGARWMSDVGPRPQVRGQIHRLRARHDDAMNPRRRRAVRQRAEHEVAAIEVRVIVRDEAHVLATEACSLSAPLVGAGEMQAERWVACDERAQLAAGVSGRAQNSNGKFMHGE